MRTPGLHHITAICGDPQANIDFYTGILGLRLIKQTVNFDDPKTYHFYYGDGVGSPGTIMTFFPWPGAPRGRPGNRQAVGTAFAIPHASLEFWVERLSSHNLQFDGPHTKFAQEYILLRDPDGLQIDLVGTESVQTPAQWAHDEIPQEHAIRGIYSVTLWIAQYERTAEILTDYLGFAQSKLDNEERRFALSQRSIGSVIDIHSDPEFWNGRPGIGTIHHIAFRATSDEQQMALHTDLKSLGLNITTQIDRNYFKSIYFREPGGVLFEIATDDPGFLIDESADSLGSNLKLPEQYEAQRAEIEASLPKINVR